MGLLLICTPGSSLSWIIPSNTCWGSSHGDMAFYFYILLRDAWLVPPRQFPLSTCVRAWSLHKGLPAPSPEPLQRQKCDVWWRTPGGTTVFWAKRMLGDLWCSGCLSDVVVVVNHLSSKTGAGSAPSEQTGGVWGKRLSELSCCRCFIYPCGNGFLKLFINLWALQSSFPLVMSLNFPSTCVRLTFHCLQSEINPVLGSAQECLNL